MTLDIDTLDFSQSHSVADEAPGFGLTILAHPDLGRIGEVAFLSQAPRRVKLSRTEPLFSGPHSRSARPLEHLVISRQPIMISVGEHSIEIDVGSLGRRVEVSAEGPPDANGRFSRDGLGRGILINLSGCVLLLLHGMNPRPHAHATGADELRGDSPQISALRAEVLRVAASDTGVLIRGETGTGKELVARAIHRASARCRGPYLAVNMAAIPEATAASALFGHQRGAFTSALREHSGYFGGADGGTLLLDEVGETPKQVQGLLLRALREGDIQPVGAAEAKKVNVRVLAATDAPLEELVAQGRFSEALLRRLEAYTIVVPPLWQRPDDIARLFVTFLEKELTELGETRCLSDLAPDARPWLPASFMADLVAYRWPGNVAELQTLARRVAIANQGAKNFRVDEWVAQRLAKRSVSPTLTETTIPVSVAERKLDPARLSDAEIVAAMRTSRFVVKEAAEQLGVSRSWLHTRLEFCRDLRQAKDLTLQEVQTALLRANGSTSSAAEMLEVSEHGLKLRVKALNVG